MKRADSGARFNTAHTPSLNTESASLFHIDRRMTALEREEDPLVETLARLDTLTARLDVSIDADSPWRPSSHGDCR
jgi:hypothetical protein